MHYHTNVHIGAIDPRIPSPVLCNPESGVRDFKFVRTPVSLIAESRAINLGIRSPVLLNAESGPGGVSRGLGVTLSATIHLRHTLEL